MGEFLYGDCTAPKFASNWTPGGFISLGVSEEWARNRDLVAATVLGRWDTPPSIEDRKLLQNEKDRSTTLHVRLLRSHIEFQKYQSDRKRITKFQSLLHEELSRERRWYQDTDDLEESREQDIIQSIAMSIDEGTWVPADASEQAADQDPRNQELNADALAEYRNTKGKGKRLLAENGEAQSSRKLKKMKSFVTERNVRDRVRCVQRRDGTKWISYRFQPKEVDMLANLLHKMLRNDPYERISIDQVIEHPWFDSCRTRRRNRQNIQYLG
ncbi:hypothetical protein RRF57_002316 [Xylaria bambusicola]|uniref:Protein kinase domain-containing protein n=1 Tax=Xylaria bambusicola TaxID=326684 RepID=A0AAN7Z6T6_9PEZI